MSNTLFHILSPWSVRISTRKFSDSEVRAIFALRPPMYELRSGAVTYRLPGIRLREKYTHDGSLGFVYRSPFSSREDLWGLSRKNRLPRRLARLR